MTIDELRTCPGCGEEKPISSFLDWQSPSLCAVCFVSRDPAELDGFEARERFASEQSERAGFPQRLIQVQQLAERHR
jgi:hypothetical protein